MPPEIIGIVGFGRRTYQSSMLIKSHLATKVKKLNSIARNLTDFFELESNWLSKLAEIFRFISIELSCCFHIYTLKEVQ